MITFGVGVPAEQANTRSFISVSAGQDHTCALATDGTAYCWGANDVGQIGNGAADASPHPVPHRVDGGISFRAIASGRAQEVSAFPAWFTSVLDIVGAVHGPGSAVALRALVSRGLAQGPREEARAVSKLLGRYLGRPFAFEAASGRMRTLTLEKSSYQGTTRWMVAADFLGEATRDVGRDELPQDDGVPF